ncbi:DMT family transporter [Albidovulum sp.]
MRGWPRASAEGRAETARSPRFGLALAAFGALVLTPDTLFMRWSGMAGAQMLAWRGLCMGVLLLALWALAGAPGRAGLLRPAGAAIALCHALNTALFALGVAIAPVPVVLFAVATAPVFAALFARLAGEKTGRAIWLPMLAVLTGVGISVLGRPPEGAPVAPGAPLAGALAGFGVAVAMAASFVIIRHARQVPIRPAIGLGSLLAGLAGLAFAGGPAGLMEGRVWAIAATGLVILPVSFLSLTHASRHTAAANVSLFLLLETVLGPVWVWAFAGEPLTPLMVLGGAIVVVTLALHLRAERRRT